MKKNGNELLKGLNNVNLESFDKYLQSSGVLVEVHAGRTRMKFAVPKKILGIAKDDEFCSEYVNSGTFSLLTKEDENALSAIESSARQAVKKFSIGLGNKYIPIDVYKNEYAPYFEEKKIKYFEKRDEIVDNWDNRVKSFKSKLETFLDTRGLTEKEIDDLKKEIYRGIPSKEQFKNSFHMDLSLSAFPVAANLSILDESVSDEVKDSIAKNSTKALYDILGNLMQDGFKSINSIVKTYNESGDLPRKYSAVLNELKKRYKKNNILKHPLIDELIIDIDSIRDLADDDDIIEECEVIMAKIYGFAKDIEVLEFLDLENAELDENTLITLHDSLRENSVAV